MRPPEPVALVTGATGGVGSACSIALSDAGYKVALLARQEEHLRGLARRLAGSASLVVPGDVTSTDSVSAAFDRVERAWGPVTVLVHAAGAGSSSPLRETTDEEWQAMLDLNMTAAFRCIRRALPRMIDAGFGRIVVIASVVAKRGEPRVAAYTASKHGALGLVRAAAAETALTGVTVNAVCPGYLDTPMTDRTIDQVADRTGRAKAEVRQLLAQRQPIGRLVTPGEVAQTMMLCVTNGAITGQGISVDGGTVQS